MTQRFDFFLPSGRKQGYTIFRAQFAFFFHEQKAKNFLGLSLA